MKKIIITLALAALPLLVSAQGTVNDLEFDFQTRTSIGADWKIAKGFHLEADYEMRTKDNLATIGRHIGTVGLSYKLPFGLKTGLSYSYIYNYRSSKGWNPRHRLTATLSYTYKAGDWNIQLREQFRWTHKTEEINAYQENSDPLTLKSRVKVSYKALKPFEPYGFVEVRNVFNDPNVNATWSTASNAYSDYSFGGYGDAYFNRVRAGLGLEWKLSKQHALDFYAMADYCYDKDIDTNQEGTTLKSLTWDQSLNAIIGVGYVFSF